MPYVGAILVRRSGFELIITEDATDNEVEVSQRWHDARERRAAELIRLEGEETFAALQQFWGYDPPPDA